jgi:hypothetical protein
MDIRGWIAAALTVIGIAIGILVKVLEVTPRAKKAWILTATVFLLSGGTVLIVLILGAFGVGIRSPFFLEGGQTATYANVQFPRQPDSYTPAVVSGKTFKNERVLLDGTLYQECSFWNVTFIYNGTTSVKFTRNKIYGTFILRSDSPAVDGVLSLMKGLGYLRPEVNFEVTGNSEVGELERH